MARESALWDRLKSATVKLRAEGHRIDLQRLENAIAAGHPDVEGCIDGDQIWIELKSEERPKRPATPIRPKLRDSQSIWHRQRCAAGCRINWVLLQVGEAHDARLYLVPGTHYDRLDGIVEIELEPFFVASPAEVLMKARAGW